MRSLLILNARIATLAGGGSSVLPRRGDAMRDLGVIERGWMRVCGSRIDALGAGDAPKAMGGERVIDARGRLVTPGFVDCHTHACYEGERLNEWEMKLAGVPYLEILAKGGGILASVRATRAASTSTLTEGVVRRTREMAAFGTTTVEVKSGYGLDTATELRMLEAITAAGRATPLRIVPTFLGAHAKDPAASRFVERTIDETLPAVAKAHPGIVADAYCETGAWSVDECVRYFERAVVLGLSVRVHTDQFNSLGMIARAVALGARSVDHLEAATRDDLELVAKSPAIAVGLPATSFCLGAPCIRAREFIDAGGALALATNANPGSAPVRAMSIVHSFAVRELRMTPAEAITTTTWNGACVLGLARECGSLEAGKSADLALWEHRDERALGYELAGSLPIMVLARGEAVIDDARGIG